ncbi:hypothetical protein [Saccharibacillus endophyticus]|uniref:Uncharacterized protein n=1 Tax=Saccharibacillus endophyticus TaxID=2060666 RepID=A0ABQ2A403_9BACL|nr:hypothetical protein [Saccharibacillus endophyticus]GGH84516.1 hypothetical protein GCM10007362_39760 [Saccharibacillus endophyticus]
MDSGYKKQVVKLRLIGWMNTLFFGLCAVVGLAAGELIMTLLGLLMTGAGIWVLIRAEKIKKVNRHHDFQYIPGKGFKRYRRTKSQKLRMLTISQWSTAALMLVVLFMGIGNVLTNLTIGLIVFLSIQFSIKERIKRHVRVDPYAESGLRHAGAIEPHEEVRALYRDFENWADIRVGTVLLAVTRYEFAAFYPQPNGSFIVDCIPLSEIRRMTVQTLGLSGRRLLLSVGDGRNHEIRCSLNGRSRLDSPEEFMSDLLRAADDALLGFDPRPLDDHSRTA